MFENCCFACHQKVRIYKTNYNTYAQKALKSQNNTYKKSDIIKSCILLFNWHIFQIGKNLSSARFEILYHRFALSFLKKKNKNLLMTKAKRLVLTNKFIWRALHNRSNSTMVISDSGLPSDTKSHFRPISIVCLICSLL